ncbi:MAG: hypothetical protein FWB86_13280 [Treponema sp.]|nr:hypothetical protein [Treponema sp.]
MAKETKFIEVSPSTVNSTIERWNDFGWELLGAPQEINYTTTHRTQETDKHYSSEYTEKTNYVKITFQRDNSIPNYKEIVSLENEYLSLKDPPPPPQDFKTPSFGIIWFLLAAAGIFFGVIPGIVIIVCRLLHNKKKSAEIEPKRQAWLAKKEEGENEVKRKRKDLRSKAKSLQ